MNKNLIIICCFFTLILQAQQEDENAINQVLDSWHRAAATANFQEYFDKMTETSVFVGTDATEHWDKQEFMEFSKPYFDAGKAWDFTPLERHVFLGPDHNIAWFDELLDTWMLISRGSGVLVREEGSWKIAHYVLSLAIPNDSVEEVIKLKKENDSILKSSILLKQPN
ncbi:MAG: nuclear transport factor 2 family protein [Robiginitalea sp.]